MKKTTASIVLGILLAGALALAQQPEPSPSQSAPSPARGDARPPTEQQAAPPPSQSAAVATPGALPTPAAASKPSISATPTPAAPGAGLREKWLVEANGLQGAEVIGDGATSPALSRINRTVVVRGTVNGACSVVAGDLFVLGNVHGGVSVLGGNMTVLGRVDGSVSVVGGDLRVAGKINGAASVVGGHIVRTPDAAISGATSDVSAGAGRHAGFFKRGCFGKGRAGGILGLLFSPLLMAVHGALLFWWLCAPLLVIILAPQAVERGEALLRADPLKAGAIGLVFWVAFWFLVACGAVMSLFLVGVPVLGLLGLVYIGVKWFGFTVVFLWLGRHICARFGWKAASLITPVVLGSLILGLLRFIPILGVMIWMVAGMLGAGMTVLCVAHRAKQRDEKIDPGSGV